MRFGRIKGRGFKIVAAAAVATLVGVGSALHASADTEVAGGAAFAGTVVDTVCQTGHCVQVDVQFAGANSNNDLAEAFTCVAHAWPDASATAIITCTLETRNGGTVYSTTPSVNPPGPVAVAADGPVHFDLGNLGGGLQVCYRGAAIFTENQIGSPLVETNGGLDKCTAPPSLIP